MAISQASTESILRSSLEKHNCKVELATKLVSFEQTSDYVVANLAVTRDGKEVRETANFDWIIGADGSHG